MSVLLLLTIVACDPAAESTKPEDAIAKAIAGLDAPKREDQIAAMKELRSAGMAALPAIRDAFVDASLKRLGNLFRVLQYNVRLGDPNTQFETTVLLDQLTMSEREAVSLPARRAVAEAAPTFKEAGCRCLLLVNRTWVWQSDVDRDRQYLHLLRGRTTYRIAREPNGVTMTIEGPTVRRRETHESVEAFAAQHPEIHKTFEAAAEQLLAVTAGGVVEVDNGTDE